MAGKNNFLQISFYFLAITSCFCVYSLIQERLMTVGFGPDEEVFRYSVFIVLINRLVTCAVASASLWVLDLPLSPSAPLALFAVPSVANVVSSTAQYEALKYVSFPMQALAKCAKSVPVMAWSWVTRTRKYYASDYFSAATVTLGCALFVLTGDVQAPSLGMASNALGTATSHVISFTTVGIVLLAVFMVFDGLTCTSQDKLFGSYNMHSCSQLLYTAAWSSVLSAGFLLASGQIWDALGFVLRHPSSLWLMLMQSAVSTTVQLFIAFTIKQYGALNFALMMTLRQFLSIVISCLVFQHELSTVQWLGTTLVIGGLVSRSIEMAKTSGHSDLAAKAMLPAMEAGETQALMGDSKPSKLIPVITASTPRAKPGPGAFGNGSDMRPTVLQPLGNMLATPLRRSTLAPAFPGSGDWKEKPG